MITEDQLNKAADNLQSNIQQNKLQSSLYAGAQSQPDTEAKLQDLAKRLNMPVDVVRAKQPEAEIDARLRSFDYDKINKETPKTAAWLSNQNNAAIAHDDVENMGQIEKTLRNVGMKISKGSLAMFSAAPAFNEGAWGVLQAGAEMGSKYGTGPLKDWGILPQDIMGVMGEEFSKYRQQQGAIAEGFVTEPGAGPTESAVYSGLQSLGLNLMTLPFAAATQSVTAPLAMMSGQVGGQSYGQAREQGLSVERSIMFAGEQTVAEYVTEKIPAGAFINNLNKGYVKAALEFAAKDLVGEQIATVWQDFNEWANLNPEKSVKEFLAERPGAAYQTLIATLVGGGGAVTIAKSAELLSGYGNNMQKAQKAEAGAVMIDQINELVKANQVITRNAESFQSFVDSVVEEGADTFYIDAKTLAQSGIAGELARISPAVAEQLDRALVGNSQVAIPIAEYAAKIAPSEYAQALRMHLRTDPEGYTPAEAEEYMKEAAPQLQAEMAKVLESKNLDDTFKQSMDVVKQTVLAEMNQAGRFTPAKNEADATLVASYYAVRAQQLGITPEELFNRRRLSVSAERVGGQQLDQGIKDYQIAHKPMSIEGGASPLHDLIDAFGEDIYGKNAEQFFGSGDTRERKTIKILKSVRNKPDALVTIYRGVPNKADKINAGDWVTLDKSVAQDYVDASLENEGIKGKIISQQVPASHITSWPDSLLEFGYYPSYNAGGVKPVGLDMEAIPAKLKVDVTKTVKGQAVTKKVLATKAITAYDQRIKSLELLRGCIGG